MDTTGMTYDTLLALGEYLGFNDNYTLQTASISDVVEFCYTLQSCPSVAHPVKENFTTYFVYSKGEVLAKGIKKADLAKFSNPLVEHNFDVEGYSTAKRLYREYMAKIEQFFAGALMYLTDTLGNPKADGLYDHARSRSDTVRETAELYVELERFIK